jgi:hypothetical protein
LVGVIRTGAAVGVEGAAGLLLHAETAIAAASDNITQVERTRISNINPCEHRLADREARRLGLL